MTSKCGSDNDWCERNVNCDHIYVVTANSGQPRPFTGSIKVCKLIGIHVDIDQ